MPVRPPSWGFFHPREKCSRLFAKGSRQTPVLPPPEQRSLEQRIVDGKKRQRRANVCRNHGGIAERSTELSEKSIGESTEGRKVMDAFLSRSATMEGW
jgi:hypothetical protein